MQCGFDSKCNQLNWVVVGTDSSGVGLYLAYDNNNRSIYKFRNWYCSHWRRSRRRQDRLRRVVGDIGSHVSLVRRELLETFPHVHNNNNEMMQYCRTMWIDILDDDANNNKQQEQSSCTMYVDEMQDYYIAGMLQRVLWKVTKTNRFELSKWICRSSPA